MKKYNLIIIILILVIIGAVAKKFVPFMFMKPFTMPPTQVSVVEAKKEKWDTSLRAIGTLEAVNAVNLSTEIDGKVTNISFNSGQAVKQGDLLVKLFDNSEKANLLKAKAQYKLAQISLERAKKLLTNKYSTQASVDQCEANLESADADVKSAEASLSKKNIIAPFNGVTGINQIKLGQYLQPGTNIATLTDLSKIYINFTQPEKDRNNLKVGQQVIAKVEAFPGKDFLGSISAIDPQVDPSTRNIKVQATIINKDSLLNPGMFAEVNSVIESNGEVITIPETAVDYSLYGNVVYIVEAKDNKLYATAKYVKIGDKKNDKVAIIEGLSENQKVIANGQVKITNGAEIVISDNKLPHSEKLTNY
jgi:multidrug efflux system membrane fusion protein